MARRNKDNFFAAAKAIDALGERFEEVSLEHFRAAVWAVFTKLVYTTPQFSGRAAANWNIGIDAPDFSVDYDAGEQMEIVPAKAGAGHEKFSTFKPLHTGHNRWAEFALDNNRYKRRLIMSGTRVFISNAVQGDVDTVNNRTSPYYLSDLQSPTYWRERLRLQNMPYETVTEVLMTESWRELMNLRGDSNEQRFFK